MTKEELLAEEHICNGKCQDDITRNYAHCKTCTRLKDFLTGYKAGKADLEKENAELKEKYNKVDIIGYDALKNLTKAKKIIKTLIALYYNPVVTKDDLKKQREILKQAEQFLQENK